VGLTTLIVAIANLSCGVLLAAIALPLQLGIMPRNNVYGVRFRQALQSDQAWIRINQYGGHWLSAWGALLALLGVVLLVGPTLLSPTTIEVLAFAPISIVVPALFTWLYARRLT